MDKFSEKYKLFYNVVDEYSDNPCISITRTLDAATKIVIPSEIDGIPVKYIAKDAFKEHKNLIEVEIEEGITTIGKSAFERVLNLQKITFPHSLKIIEDNAFIGCKKLANVVTQEGLEEIGERAFIECPFKKFDFPDSLTRIGKKAFAYTELQHVNFGKNLKSICSRAFSYSKNLETITFNECLKSIDEFAFLDCSKLKDIKLPDSVEVISESIVEGCTNLKTFHFGTNTKLLFLSLGFAFGCKSLEKITVSPDNNHYKVINNILYDIHSNTLVLVPAALDVKHINIPKWAEELGPFCFADNKNIETIKFNRPNIGGLYDALTSGQNITIICPTDSTIYKIAKANNINVRASESQIDVFLENLNTEKSI